MNNESDAERVLRVIEQTFQDYDFTYDQIEEPLAFTLNFESAFGDLNCVALVDEDLHLYSWYVRIPEAVPPEARPRVAEYFTRVNCSVAYGNFELDLDDGEVRFRITLDFEGGELTTVQIGNSIEASLSTVDIFLPGMLSVIHEGRSPAEACEEAASAAEYEDEPEDDEEEQAEE